MLLGKRGALLSHNLFAYCANNPIVSLDDSGCFWIGIYHYQLQKVLIAEYPGLMMEVTVYMGDSHGRIDLYDPISGECWEVKPHNDPWPEVGAIQLQGYVGGSLNPNSSKFKEIAVEYELSIGDPIFEGSFVSRKLNPGYGMVVDYWTLPTGVVVYKPKKVRLDYQSEYEWYDDIVKAISVAVMIGVGRAALGSSLGNRLRTGGGRVLAIQRDDRYAYGG